jgi:hypothetical protein
MRTCQTSHPATGPGHASARSSAVEPGAVEPVAPTHQVIVPRTPGPLRILGLIDARPTDELDEAIDDLFGPTTDERPGRFDAALIAGGLALGGWAMFADGGGLAMASGVILLLLGIALPARAIIRFIRYRGVDLERRRAASAGYPLDASSPTTVALVEAYEALFTAAAGPHVDDDTTDGLDAAHLALVEVATLLGGAAPIVPAEVAYVDRRTRAIRELTADIIATRRARTAEEAADDAFLIDARRARTTALAGARDELESSDALGSLSRLGSLRGRLRTETDDGAG